MVCKHEDVLYFGGEPVLPLTFKVCRYLPSPSANGSIGSNSFLPFRYGVAGLLTGNHIYAGLLYLAYLLAVSTLVLQKVKADPDSRKVQSRIVALDCAYIAISGISFFMNVRPHCTLH